MYLLTVWVTVAEVTVMFSRLLRTATPIGEINCSSRALSMGKVLLVEVSIKSPEWVSTNPSLTASNRDNSLFLSAL